MITKAHARILRKKIEELALPMTDADAYAVPELFKAWKTDTAYQTGDRVQYESKLYKCLQGHTSQADWNPVDAVSLWARVLIPDPEVIPEWVQPDSTNPYMKGDKVAHNGHTWISTVDNNVWEPGVYGWEIVE